MNKKNNSKPNKNYQTKMNSSKSAMN